MEAGQKFLYCLVLRKPVLKSIYVFLLRVNQIMSHLSDSMLDSIWSFPLPLFLCLLSSSLWGQDSDQISTHQPWRQTVLTAMGWRGSSSADMLTDVLISHLHNGTQKDNSDRIARL